jgi:4-hydroxy-tetrahydrodipicolinate reductase
MLCTSSALRVVAPQIETILKAKRRIVSTTEELAYPVKSNAASAKKIDAMAKRARVAVLGTGVNPGFVMDALPIALTSVCESVTAVEVDRVQDARIRRLPFQQKIGAGLSVDAFMAKVKDGSVRHVGLAESISMIADALGWKLDRITDDVQPKIAEAPVSSAFMNVARGQVAGLVQDGVGYRKGKAVITHHMEAYLGAPETYDAVRIAGIPPIEMKILGGVHGDIATVSMVVNSIPKVLQAPPGLRTMRDMVLPSFGG